jgi:multisubunit Na+/H+ antiporter MnhB subunit
VSTLDWMLDGTLALALPLVAWRVLASRDLRQAVVLFIALGLLSALAWARLAAPDIALVEAAVGAGLTGALVMSSLGWLGDPVPAAPGAGGRRLAAAVLLPVVVAGLAWAVLSLPAPSRGLAGPVMVALPDTGVSHPVTAVLLNLRAYDTLLELLVLVVAALGIGVLLPAAASAPRGGPPGGSMVVPLARLLVPGFVLVAGYVVWRGSHAPGGAFQAGAVLAGGGVLLLLGRLAAPPSLSSRRIRLALLVGPLFFLLVAAAPLPLGGNLLEYPKPWAGALILAIESLLTLSIGLVLVMFFPARLLAGEVRRPEREAPR